MARNQTLNRQIRDARQETILEAALQLFVRKGLAATSSAEIAAAAGASHGLVYHYFPSKEAIYVALVRRAMEASSDLTARALKTPGSAWDRLRAVCAQMLLGGWGNVEYTLLVLQATVGGPVPDEARALIQSHADASVTHLADLVRQAQVAGDAAGGDPRELAQLLSSIVLGCLASTTVTGLGRETYPTVDRVLRVLRP
jgi:AcrR family transcriptional regulator